MRVGARRLGPRIDSIAGPSEKRSSPASRSSPTMPTSGPNGSSRWPRSSHSTDCFAASRRTTMPRARSPAGSSGESTTARATLPIVSTVTPRSGPRRASAPSTWSRKARDGTTTRTGSGLSRSSSSERGQHTSTSLSSRAIACRGPERSTSPLFVAGRPFAKPSSSCRSAIRPPIRRARSGRQGQARPS